MFGFNSGPRQDVRSLNTKYETLNTLVDLAQRSRIAILELNVGNCILSPLSFLLYHLNDQNHLNDPNDLNDPNGLNDLNDQNLLNHPNDLNRLPALYIHTSPNSNRNTPRQPIAGEIRVFEAIPHH